MRPIQSNYSNPGYFSSQPIVGHSADQAQAQSIYLQMQAHAQSYSYGQVGQYAPQVSDWAIPKNATGFASMAYQAAALQNAVLSTPSGHWGARSAVSRLYYSQPAAPVFEEPFVEDPELEDPELEEPEFEERAPADANRGGNDDVIRQKGGRGRDTQRAKGGKGNDKIVQKGGRGADKQVAKGGRGNDKIVQKGGKGAGNQVIKGGKGKDHGVIFAGKNVKVIGQDGKVLFEKGAGTRVVRLKGVEDVTVRTRKQVLFQS